MLRGAELRDELRNFLKKRKQRVTDLFNELDVDDNARISKKELKRALGQIGFNVPTLGEESWIEILRRRNIRLKSISLCSFTAYRPHRLTVAPARARSWQWQ